MDHDHESQIKLKRLSYRAWHRGMKEMDLILGQFADTRLSALSQAALLEFETILNCSDVDLYRWITGAAVIPDAFDGPIMREICRAAPNARD